MAYRAERPKEKAEAEALQQSLGKVGIKLTLKPYPQGDYFGLYAGKPDYAKANNLGLLANGWGADWPDGFGFLQQITDSRVIRPGGGNTNLSVKIPAVDALLDQALLTTDTAAREKLWGQIDKTVMENAVVLPGVWANVLLYRSPNLTNVFVNEGLGGYVDYISWASSAWQVDPSVPRVGSHRVGVAQPITVAGGYPPAGHRHHRDTPARCRCSRESVFRFIIRRLLAAVVMLFVVSAVVFGIFFFVPRLAGATPDDLASRYVGRTAGAAQVHQAAVQLGFTEPVYVQYGHFVHTVVLGTDYNLGPVTEHCAAPCLGYSFITQNAVLPEITDRLPVTLSLAIGAALIWLFFGVATGVLSALRRGSVFDRAAMGVALAGVSLPIFFTGLLALSLFSYQLALDGSRG